jgi:hypothetical protein
MKPLQDFGFGKASFWEGGVGMFVFAGIGERPNCFCHLQSALGNSKITTLGDISMTTSWDMDLIHCM